MDPVSKQAAAGTDRREKECGDFVDDPGYYLHCLFCRNVFWSAVHGRYQSEFDHFYLMAGHIPDRFHFKHLPFSQDHEKGDAAVGGSVDFGQCVHCWNFQIDYFVPASKPEGTSGAGAGTYDFINFNLV